MTDIKYMREKNKILRECLGLDFDLVPEDQMENCEVQYSLGLSTAGGDSCPYCKNYYMDGCRSCPMAKAYNECCSEEDNTWDRYMDMVEFYHGHLKSPAYEPMKKLIEQYNREI